MRKTIRSSKRGLTFAVTPTEEFYPGSRYQYIVSGNTIEILPQKEGLKVSRKKSGQHMKALFDLRNLEIKELLRHTKQLCLDIKRHCITVTLIKEPVIVRKCQIIPIESYLGQIQIPISLAAGNEHWTQELSMPYQSVVQEETYVKKELQQVFSVISLFSGAGMLDYPFLKDNAFIIKKAVEMDPYAAESYKANIGSRIHVGDIRNLTISEECDVVIGGPPCTAHSNANRHSRLEDHQDYFLVDEYCRIIEETDPKIFAIENVPEFVTLKDGFLLRRIMDALPRYIFSHRVVHDAKVGGYTNRKRVIIFGSRIGTIDIPSVNIRPWKTVRNALKKVTSEWYNFSDVTKSNPETVRRMKLVRPGHNFKDIPELAHKDYHSDRYKRLDWGAISPTIANWRKLPLIHPSEDRTLSVAEASALMGFSKDFKFLGSLAAKQQQCANGCSLAIGTFVKNIIKKALMTDTPAFA